MKVTVSAPSRLHFGLFAVGHLVDRTFGGVGLMVQSPRTIVSAQPAPELQIHDASPDAADADRQQSMNRAVELWFERFGGELQQPSAASVRSAKHLPVELKVVRGCPRHSGLGSGTQLALSTGLALQHFFQLPIPRADEISIALGRAKRSAIGTYGSYEGGFLIDRGKTAAELIAPIDLRLDFPEHWPIAIVRIESADAAGLHGPAEVDAFERIQATTPDQLDRMQVLARKKIGPGVANQDYDLFASGVEEFCLQSGRYFQDIQGGIYASETIATAIATIQSAGVPCAGQSSWGPSVFAIGRDQVSLQAAVDRLHQQFPGRCRVTITSADNQGTAVDTGPANTESVSRSEPSTTSAKHV